MALTGPKPSQAKEPEPRGIPCRKCGCEHHYVEYTRRRSGFLLRARRCRNCGHRFTTQER